MKRVWIAICIVGALIGCVIVAGGVSVQKLIAIDVPAFPPVQKAIWLDQNWSKDESRFFHHALQGSTTFGIPYEWFMAIEQPVLSLSSPGLVSDPAYLDRFGFMNSEAGSALPVGFEYGEAMVSPTTGKAWTNPQTGQAMTTIGLTCAACHTGRLTYKGTELRIDGGAAMIDLNMLRRAMAISYYMTRYVPFRFDRFADRVLGKDARPDARMALRDKLDALLKGVARVNRLDQGVAADIVPEGIGRLDALNRIGNELFGLGLGIDQNYVGTSAPVRYPHIWDASRFDWVEYNSSIQQPMIRNAGEALGLGVAVDLEGTPAPTFRSNLDLDSIYKIEVSLRGAEQPSIKTGITGLRPPTWATGVLPPIDQARAAKGAALYKDLCQSCHLPPIGSEAFWDPKLRQTFGPHALILPVVPLSQIGTDPAQAANMAERKLVVPQNLGLSGTDFGPALGQLVQKIVDRWYEAQRPPTTPDARRLMDGELPNGIRTPLAYKARPLDGIWATAPYLHNGSVPTLYALLSPLAERPKTFTIGSREFDPVDVGLGTEPIAGGTLIDTSRPGDRNIGHEFDDGPARQGVIGRKLSEEERRDLVEYLKTL